MIDELKSTRVCYGEEVQMIRVDDCIVFGNKDSLRRIVEKMSERKKGEWIENHTTCSECGWQMIDDVLESPNMVFFKYCPNCGADMRGE